MLTTFFTALRRAQVPVSLREYLTLLEALDRDLAGHSVEQFYYLSRAILVKDERNIDKFDRVFGTIFRGAENPLAGVEPQAIPADWLRQLAEAHFTPQEMAALEAIGWSELMRRLAERLAEQKGRHEGGSKWIGTLGTSPYGARGYNPQGIRIGQDKSRQGRAVKVWDQRVYRDLDGSVELGTRSIKMALRRLRHFARSGAADELDLAGTIHGTAEKAYLDIHMRPQRRNAVEVLLFFDIGGSMDWHVKEVEALFSAARAEFKHMQSFYFHNCLYEFVWGDNRRRLSERTPTFDILRTYGRDYKVIFVGDAAMSTYEVTLAGGSVEHQNPEPGAVWLERVTALYPHVVWLNPIPRAEWHHTGSIGLIGQLLEGRMFPLTLDGLDAAMRELGR